MRQILRRRTDTVKPTIRLRSQHFKNLVNKVKKMNTVENTIIADKNKHILLLLMTNHLPLLLQNNLFFLFFV